MTEVRDSIGIDIEAHPYCSCTALYFVAANRVSKLQVLQVHSGPSLLRIALLCSHILMSRHKIVTIIKYVQPPTLSARPSDDEPEENRCRRHRHPR